jgi:hypothetical protein
MKSFESTRHGCPSRRRRRNQLKNNIFAHLNKNVDKIYVHKYFYNFLYERFRDFKCSQVLVKESKEQSEKPLDFCLETNENLLRSHAIQWMELKKFHSWNGFSIRQFIDILRCPSCFHTTVKANREERQKGKRNCRKFRDKFLDVRSFRLDFNKKRFLIRCLEKW